MDNISKYLKGYKSTKLDYELQEYCRLMRSGEVNDFTRDMDILIGYILNSDEYNKQISLIVHRLCIDLLKKSDNENVKFLANNYYQKIWPKYRVISLGLY